MSSKRHCVIKKVCQVLRKNAQTYYLPKRWFYIGTNAIKLKALRIVQCHPDAVWKPIAALLLMNPLPWSVGGEQWGGRWVVWGWGLAHSAARPSWSCSAAPSAGPLLRSAAAGLWDDQLEPCSDLGPATQKQSCVSYILKTGWDGAVHESFL